MNKNIKISFSLLLVFALMLAQLFQVLKHFQHLHIYRVTTYRRFIKLLKLVIGNNFSAIVYCFSINFS